MEYFKYSNNKPQKGKTIIICKENDKNSAYICEYNDNEEDDINAFAELGVEYFWCYFEYPF